MRRSDKAITDREELDEIIRRSQVCRVAMCDGAVPYVVPLCFGYRAPQLYFHSAPQGRKLDILRSNPNVCVEFDLDHMLVPAPISCGISMRYRSVLAVGTAVIVDDPDERCRGLEAIVWQYVDTCTDFSDEMLQRTVVFRVDIHTMTGKQSGY